MTSSQISAAGAYAQAERLVATIPVRPVDPTRRRFEVDDQTAATQTPVDSRAETDGADADGAASGSAGGEATSTGSGRGGFGLLGAFTSFLARLFAQSDSGDSTVAAGAAQSGAQAYARAAGTTDVGNYSDMELVSPSFPRLSSGRAVDLSV